jgi:hypothetical protein
MTPWDSTKVTEDGDGTVDSDEQLTADEWNRHVTDGHFPSDALNQGTDANGNPVFTDPANGDQVVLRYDSGAGQWEIVNVNLELNTNDITSAGSVATGEISAGTNIEIHTLADVSESDVRTALSNVGRGDHLVTTGDFTVASPIQLDTRVTWYHYGKITLSSDFLRIGHNSRTQFYEIGILNIDGQSYTNGYTVFDLGDARQGLVQWGNVSSVGTIAYCHSTSGASRALDNVFTGRRCSGMETGIDLHADGGTVEGNRFHHMSMFDSTKTVVTRGSDLVVHNKLSGLTIHGSTGSHHTHEIDEQADSQNYYNPVFVGSGTVSLDSDSNYIPNNDDWQVSQETDCRVINGIVFAGYDAFATAQDAINWAQNNGYRTVTFPPGDYSSIDISQDGMCIIGLGNAGANTANAATFDGGTSDHAVDIQSNNVRVINLSAKTTSGGGNANNAVNTASTAVWITDCVIQDSDQHGVYADGIWINISGCISKGVDGTKILLDTNSQSCVVDSNINVGTVTDNGSGNVVGDNS